MKILVTGGAGYIGSVTVEMLMETGADVVVLDDLSLGHRAAVHPAAKLELGSLAERATIDAVPRWRSRGAILWNRFGSAKASSDQRSHYDAGLAPRIFRAISSPKRWGRADGANRRVLVSS